MSADPSKQIKLGFIAGLVPREKSMSFERMLFRATRGNVFLRQAVVDDPVVDPVSGEKVSFSTHFLDAFLFFLSFFLGFFWGGRNKNSKYKLLKDSVLIRIPFVLVFCFTIWLEIYVL